MTNEHLRYISSVGRHKPETIRNRQNTCPFCNFDEAELIMEAEGPIVLVKNKFQTLKNAFQTVLIENDSCEHDLSTYPEDHLHNVFEFGIRKWAEMEASNKYRSVLFFKNHGPMSGGTIKHPHMQIVGLDQIDYRDQMKKDYFEGLLIHRCDRTELNVSVKPKVGFYEFNVISSSDQIKQMADLTQIAVRYILNHYPFPCDSYNLFFYRFDEKIVIKVVPRFVTSPYYVGYSIPQVGDLLETIVTDIRSKFDL